MRKDKDNLYPPSTSAIHPQTGHLSIDSRIGLRRGGVSRGGISGGVIGGGGEGQGEVSEDTLSDVATAELCSQIGTLAIGNSNNNYTSTTATTATATTATTTATTATTATTNTTANSTNNTRIGSYMPSGVSTNNNYHDLTHSLHDIPINRPQESTSKVSLEGSVIVDDNLTSSKVLTSHTNPAINHPNTKYNT